MIVPFLITALQDARYIMTKYGYPHEVWGTKELKKYFGLRYSLIYYLEKKGILPPIPRDATGHLRMSPQEVFECSWIVENYLTKLYLNRNSTKEDSNVGTKKG